MSDILHTYHRTSLSGRGIHALTTTDHEEAYAMLAAGDLRAALAEVLAWDNTMLEAIEAQHGEGAVTIGIRAALHSAAAVLSRMKRETP